MKNQHIKIKEDTLLLKELYATVKERLTITKTNFLIKIWFKFLFYFLSSVFLYVSLFYITDPIYFIIVFILYGFIYLLFAFNFAHDLSHDNVFKNKKLNNLFYTIIYTFVGAHSESWKVRHIHSHHLCPNVDGQDADMKITKLIRVMPTQEHYWFHKYQHIYAPFLYMTYSLFWIFKKDFANYFYEDEYLTKNLKYHIVFWIQKITYLTFILILPITLSKVSLEVVIISFFAMHIVQSIFLLFTFFITHHVLECKYPTTQSDGKINTSWIMNQIKSSNDIQPFSPITNFILGGFNSHIAHHLFPNIHHIHYPQLNHILYDFLIKRNIIPNQTTYWGGIISHLKLLRKRGAISINEDVINLEPFKK